MEFSQYKKEDSTDLTPIKKYFYPNRILDIGANIGQFHYFAKEQFPDAYIFSVEASEECEIHLKKLTNSYYIGLLAKDNSEYDFYTTNNPISTGNSIYRELTDWYSDDKINIIKKKGVKLDDILNEEFDLIKLDTQGSELDIITGGRNICSRAKGILLEVSMTPYNQGSPLYDEVCKFMDELGFKEAETLDELVNTYTNLHQKNILFINKKMEHFYQNLGEDWFTYPDLYSSMVKQFPEGSHFVEVGSWKGRSSAYMAVEIHNSGKKIQFDCVDTWDGADVHRDPYSPWFEPLLSNKDGLYIEFLKNIKPVKYIINPIRSTSVSASKLYEDESLDFVFIDGDHSYESVKEDIEHWLPKVKVGGIIAGHDYGPYVPPGGIGPIGLEGVTKAVHESFDVKDIQDFQGCWVYKKEMKKDLILTVAINYTSEMIRPFIKSLERVNFKGTLMVLSYEPIQIDYSVNIDIINQLIKPEYIQLKLNTINNLRPFYYKIVLDNYLQYENILLVDSRDVIFQDNPFNYFKERVVHFGMEDNTIGNCWINTTWIKRVYGDEYFEKVKDRPILNGGIIAGNRNEIMPFLEFFIQLIIEKSSLDTGDNSFVVEQAIPIYYSNAFPDKVKEHYNNTKEISTLGQTNFISINKDNQIVNQSGEVYAIVHQYDRFEILDKIIKDIYN